MVYFYQEFTTGPESITHGASGRKDRRVSVDKLWTRPSTDAHTRETTYLHANMPSTRSRISEHTEGCVCAGFGRQQEMTEVTVSRPRRKNKRESLLLDEHTARQNMKTFLRKVQTEVGDTLGALLASGFSAPLENELVLVALQSNHSSATRKAFNDCLSQSGNRGNEIL